MKSSCHPSPPPKTPKRYSLTKLSSLLLLLLTLIHHAWSQEEESTKTNSCPSAASAASAASSSPSSSLSSQEDPSSCQTQIQTPKPITKTRIIKDDVSYLIPQCSLYLAPTTNDDDTTTNQNDSSSHPSLGMYTAQSFRKGQAIGTPELLLQIHNVNHTLSSLTPPSPLSSLIQSHSWNGQRTGGNSESTQSVSTLLFGLGSMTRLVSTSSEATILPYLQPQIDEANVVRSRDAGSGAMSHYHNVSFYARRDLNVGDELTLWVQELGWEFVEERSKARIVVGRGDTTNELDGTTSSSTPTRMTSTPTTTRKELSWLQQYGSCVDQLQPRQSKLKGVGRGAFSKRYIPKGSLIAPVPMKYIGTKNDTLVTYPRRRTTKGGEQSVKEQRIRRSQLLLNYCHGRPSSSSSFQQAGTVGGNGGDETTTTELFVALSPMVNYINHAPTPSQVNAKLIPSQRFSNHHDWLYYDYIATQDIYPNEEILTHYGHAWETSWSAHVSSWSPILDSYAGEAYTPAYVMDDVASILRTEKEQISHPFPENLRTSCFYRYSTLEKDKVHGIVKGVNVGGKEEEDRTTVKWTMDRKTFEFDHLRPCHILQREEIPSREKQFVYTVRMYNRPGLAPNERIPTRKTESGKVKTTMHVVTQVPRAAIRFTDRAYSTDQHLENAFRHEIGLPQEEEEEVEIM